jgi:hypothetical protein
LREKNILRHIPTARIVEDYLYGQIHFDDLDDGSVKDRFTSDREGVIAEDQKYKTFLKTVKEKIMRTIIEDWDDWRRKHKLDGDSENPKISRKDRKSGELFNAVSDEFTPPKGNKNKPEVDKWVDELSEDATFNFGSYAECFVSENLIRKYIAKKKIAMSPEANEAIVKWKKVETESKQKGNISIDIRKEKKDTSYLAMNDMAYLVDSDNGKAGKKAALSRDAESYKPIRDAMAHTSLLTDSAKSRLTTIFDNIRGRIKDLLKNP